MPVVKQLNVYPVKGCKGISIQLAHITPTGVPLDRNWVIISSTSDKGRMITQRVEPKLALIETALPVEALQGNWGKLPPDAALTLKAPGMEPIQVPLVPLPGTTANLRPASVWEWNGLARDEGDAVADWLTKHLGKPLRLVRYAGIPGVGSADADDTRRPTDDKWAPGHEIAFADCFPMLMISEGSLEELNKHSPIPLRMNRFRPNIVVGDCEPFAEDTWEELSIGAAEFKAAKPCSRCKVPTTNQETAEQGEEPLKVLGRFRQGSQLGWAQERDFKRAVFFGFNLVPEKLGPIAVGDTVQVAASRDFSKAPTPAAA